MEKPKTLLIVEQASSDLKQSVNESSDVIYLEGVFTEFKVRNRNGRIYEANDFIPKMNELAPKIEKKTLLGELDHPVNFDISLKSVSHVIESLVYDKENDRVIGKIRLLNTEAGKQAQALVKDGIPLHISSRAAGQINPQTGKVTLEKLFTYDLVADPGFENAELKRVNEAYGFGNLENVFIYECEMPVENDNLNKENITSEMNNNINEQKSVNIADFQKYTEYIAGVIEGVKNSIDDIKKQMHVNESAFTAAAPSLTDASDNNLRKYVEYLAEQVQNISNHNDYLAAELQKNCDHNDYLAEQVEKNINFSDYLAENLENSIEYSKYLSEKLNENFAHNDYLAEQLQLNCDHNDYLAEKLQTNSDHNDYLAEKLQTNADHNDYLAEKLQTMGNFSNYLAEQLQKNCDHNDYIAEQLQTTAKYAEYLAENLEKNFAHNDYLAENINNTLKYNEYLAEQLQKVADNTTMINETKETVKVDESVNNDSNNNIVTEKTTVETKTAPVVEKQSNAEYKSMIAEKLDAILNAQAVSVSKDNFLNFLSEGRRNEFNSLEEPMKDMITEAMNAAAVKNEAQANIVWKSVYESKKGLDIVENMPKIYKERWDALSDKRKSDILNEAKFYNLKSTNDIEYFWSTRDLRNEAVIVERVDTDSAKTWSYDKDAQNDYISSIMGRTKKNMRGW